MTVAAALLALDSAGPAAIAVAGVPDDYTYRVSFDPQGLLCCNDRLLFEFALPHNVEGKPGSPTIGDREGINGLDYRSSGDPRTASLFLGQGRYGGDVYYPEKYYVDPPAMLVLANGVEARLIEAEAALRASAADGVWLQKLNGLRQQLALSDTTDPGSDPARVSLLFRERAFWLYLTAHRQGDLRRLIRQYDRDPSTVYPTGAYPAFVGSYGEDMTVPVPDVERKLNPKYTGCFHRNA